jgi:hypothetical protein
MEERVEQNNKTERAIKKKGNQEGALTQLD